MYSNEGVASALLAGAVHHTVGYGCSRQGGAQLGIAGILRVPFLGRAGLVETHQQGQCHRRRCRLRRGRGVGQVRVVQGNMHRTGNDVLLQRLCQCLYARVGAPSKAIQGVVEEGCRTAMSEAQALVNVCVVRGASAGQ